jgi:hypothetical protein
LKSAYNENYTSVFVKQKFNLEGWVIRKFQYSAALQKKKRKKVGIMLVKKKLHPSVAVCPIGTYDMSHLKLFEVHVTSSHTNKLKQYFMIKAEKRITQYS